MNADWATFGIPLVVSLIALGGVIYTNHRTGKNMIDAERERARLAEVAEDRRAANTVEAEDRRARAAIEAENHRHENELRRATREHLLDAVRELYFELESARRALYDTSLTVADMYDTLEVWRERSEAYREHFGKAVTDFGTARDKVTLLASKPVSEVTDSVWRLAIDAEFEGKALADGEPIVEYGRGGLPRYQAVHRSLRKATGELLDEMRKELHPTVERTEQGEVTHSPSGDATTGS